MSKVFFCIECKQFKKKTDFSKNQQKKKKKRCIDCVKNEEIDKKVKNCLICTKELINHLNSFHIPGICKNCGKNEDLLELYSKYGSYKNCSNCKELKIIKQFYYQPFLSVYIDLDICKDCRKKCKFCNNYTYASDKIKACFSCNTKTKTLKDNNEVNCEVCNLSFFVKDKKEAFDYALKYNENLKTIDFKLSENVNSFNLNKIKNSKTLPIVKLLHGVICCKYCEAILKKNDIIINSNNIKIMKEYIETKFKQKKDFNCYSCKKKGLKNIHMVFNNSNFFFKIICEECHFLLNCKNINIKYMTKKKFLSFKNNNDKFNDYLINTQFETLSDIVCYNKFFNK